jgi:PadR family transcriptional regulator, regulatory protein PadR
MTDRDLYGGLIRLHLLHHAAVRPIYGFSMIEELGRHGYQVSPGTLYPILHGLEKKGYLRSIERRLGHTARRMYEITPSGRRALKGAKRRVYELFGEMFFDGAKADHERRRVRLQSRGSG